MERTMYEKAGVIKAAIRLGVRFIEELEAGRLD
jgi:hypothetical protein